MSAPRFAATFLVENTARDGFASEHGLSLWIDTPHGAILFDTGQGAALLPNAERLGLDLAKVRFLVLSHGHYDHAGGVPAVLARNSGLTLIHHPDVFRRRYSVRPNQPARDISMPEPVVAAIRALPEERVCSCIEPIEVVAGVGTTGQVPRNSTFEDVGGPFFLDPEGKAPDAIPDDISLWFLTPDGLVVITGCAHAGLVNTVHQARRLTGEHRVAGVIGGFHLNAATRRRLDETARTLVDWNVRFVAPCHCTGHEATAFLQTVLGDRVKPATTGDTIRF